MRLATDAASPRASQMDPDPAFAPARKDRRSWDEGAIEDSDTLPLFDEGRAPSVPRDHQAPAPLETPDAQRRGARVVAGSRHAARVPRRRSRRTGAARAGAGAYVAVAARERQIKAVLAQCGPLPIKAIGQRIRLGKSRCRAIVANLCEIGVLQRGQRLPSSVMGGRPPVLYELHPEYAETVRGAR